MVRESLEFLVARGTQAVPAVLYSAQRNQEVQADPDDQVYLADPCHLWVQGSQEGRYCQGFQVLLSPQTLIGKGHRASRGGQDILSHLSVRGIRDRRVVRLFLALQTILSLQKTLGFQDDLVVQGNPSLLGNLSRPSFLVFLVFPLQFLVLGVQGVPWALVIQGCLAVLEFPSFQQVLGNLSLLCLLFDRGNLVVRSVPWRQEIQADQECQRSAHLEDQEGRDYQDTHQLHALPSVQGHHYVHHHQVIQVLLASQAGPCLQGVLVNRSVLGNQV